MTSLPKNLDGIFQNISEEHTKKIVAGWSTPRSIVSFRVNCLKSSREEVVTAFEASALPYSVWAFSEDAFYLDRDHEYALR